MATLAWLIAFGMLGQLGDPPEPAWALYSAKKGGFRVRIPGKPEEKDDRTETDRGKLDYHLVSATDGLTIYSVVFHDNPPIGPDARATYLERQGDGFLSLKRGDRLKDREIALGEHPGRELEFEAPPERGISREQVLWKIRYYLVGDRLYQLMTARPKSIASSRDVDRFLESFELRPGAAEGGEEPDWKPFRPKGGGFEVEMPGEPSEVGTTVEVGGKTLTNFCYSAHAGSIDYAVSFVDYDAASVSAPGRLLDAARDGAVEVSGGRKVGERRIRLGRHPGRQFSVRLPEGDGKDGGLAVYHIYLVGRRLYQLVAKGPREDRPTEEIGRFFRSFKLVAPR